MENIDDFLASLGVDLTSPTPKVTETPTVTPPSYMEEVLNDFIQEEVVPEETKEEVKEEEPIVEETPQEESTEEEITQQEEDSQEEFEEANTLSDDAVSDILSGFGINEEPELVEEIDDNDDDNEGNDDWEGFHENVEEGQDVNAEIAAVADGRSFDDVIQDHSEPVFDAVFTAPTVTEETPQPTPRRRPRRQLTPVENTPEDARIPLNSPTLIMDESTSRFSGAEWFNEIQSKRIILAGCGGIGSNLAFQLSRMIPAGLYIYDDDNVETVNMSGQLFSREDVGKSKVDAIANMIAKYTAMQNIFSIKEKFTNESEPGDIMICGFDNMEARRTFFGMWCNHLLDKTPEEKKQCLFMDGRLSIDTLQILCITGDDDANILRYQNEFLFSDAEADETICSMKQTTYLACMIASLMTNLFTNFVAGTLDPIIPYDLPFFTEYNAQSMIFKTEN